jgi:DNA-binding transcriptional ArsR family regulator
MPNDLYKALAHPIRRGIIERLAESSATVGDATRNFGVSKPTISGHLKVLEEAGVVVRVIDGRTHRLRLDATKLDEASAWLERQRALWLRAFDAVEGILEEQKKGDA